MKKIFINIGLISGLFILMAINACSDKIDPVVDELSFNRAFTPVDLSAQISNITTVTLVWGKVKNTATYDIEIYQGTTFSSDSLVYTTVVDSSATTLVYVLPAGDTQFSAKLNAVSSIEGVAESKWISVGFKTLPENLFLGYTSELTGLGSCIVRWKPGSAATALQFDNGTKTSYPVTAAEATAGVKNLTGIAIGKYQISLMNTTFVRGKTNILIEGNVMLGTGDDLATAISALPAGGVLLLGNGLSFSIAANFLINKSIKIRAINKLNLPTIYAAAGASTTAPLFLIDPSLTAADSIVFQNVVLTGYINNVNIAPTMVTGVYDQGTSNACNIGLLKFTGCNIQHFSRHLIRLRGTAVQIINNLLVDDCILFDYGTNSTSYGIISSNSSTGTINNIKFSNSTIYRFLSYLVLYTNATSCNSISVTNCSLNQITYTPGSTARFIMDTNGTTFTGTGIAISNCIFGSTAVLPGRTNGIRTSGALLITNSYGTSDFDDTFTAVSSIKSLLTAYTSASTALWIDPVTTNNFHFLDAGFAGKNSTGDPRWRN